MHDALINVYTSWRAQLPTYTTLKDALLFLAAVKLGWRSHRTQSKVVSRWSEIQVNHRTIWTAFNAMCSIRQILSNRHMC